MSEYRGYFLKVKGVPVNLKFFQEYESTPNGQTDLNPWTDTTGLTHRNVLPHTKSTIVFTTPRLHLKEKMELQELFPNRTNVELEYWNDDDNRYTEGVFYIPDIKFQVMMPYPDDVVYRPVTYTLVEY